MASNTSQLKTFAQNTRTKLVSIISSKLHYLLNADNAELRGWEKEIARLRQAIASKGKTNVIEEVAYTWFNRVMALRYMDARGFNSPLIVSIAEGQTRPQILEEAMGGSFDEELKLTDEEKLLEGRELYRKLLIAVCNKFNDSMPFLFERLSDYTEMLLPDDLLSEQSFVTDIRNGMSDEECQNVEILGWLYQFYITDRKADAEKNKSRRGGLSSEEQAAATQLFTPHWIVRYMVENSLGRIWMTLHPESRLIESMPYYIAPVEGQVDVIPEDIKSAEDIRFIDPCMGSGHILVYAFDLFTKMYEEEGKSTKEIPELILRNNIYGIDIDPRCYQLASFALTMKARDYYRRYLRNTVNPNVIALQSIDSQTIESAGSWDEDSLIWQMEYLDTIGSLLKVTPEEAASIHVEDGLWGEQLRIMKTQTEYLSRSYHCVVTNPPYLGKGIGNKLKEYITKEYPDSKADTMATFMERCAELSAISGKIGMINMQAWMFLGTYDKLRESVLQSFQFDSLLLLGTRAFDELSGDVVQSVTFVLSNHKPFLDSIFCRLVKGNSVQKEKSFLKGEDRYMKDQRIFLSIPDYRMIFWGSNQFTKILEGETVKKVSDSRCGMATGNNNKYVRNWCELEFDKIGIGLMPSEVSRDSHKWYPYTTGGSARRWYGNIHDCVLWENDGDVLRNTMHPNGERIWAHNFNLDKIFQKHISWSDFVTTGLMSFRYFPQGFIFDASSNSAFPKSSDSFLYILGLCNTKIIQMIKPMFNPGQHFTSGNFLSIPWCDSSHEDINSVVSECVSIAKYDWDAHETSWDFQTNELVRIAKAKNLNTLHSILAHYKREWEQKFFKLHENEEELNRRFIEIYGLQDELTPDVPLDEVTILQKGEISVEEDEIVWHDDVIVKQFISYLVGCFMGRYSIERDGLIIANQGQKIEDLDFESTTIEIDDDGIIPIIQEADFFTDDMTYRVEKALEALFGSDKKDENLRFIQKALSVTSLRDYFYKTYYADHLATYSVKGAKRPIYWLFSSKMGDKRKKGYFKALVYMHRMEPDTLSKLHADYVMPYLTKLDRQLNEVEDELSRDDLPNRKKMMTEVEALRDKIREVKEFADKLAQMASHRQSIDLDDGVAVNYPKYYPLLEPVKFPKPSDED